MKRKRNVLCAFMVCVMMLACICTAYATSSVNFSSTDGKTKAVMTYSATWKWLSKDVGTASMEITSHTGSDSRYSMASVLAYKNGSLVTCQNAFGYGSATAIAKVNADKFRYRSFITQYANGGTGLGNSGWITVTED